LDLSASELARLHQLAEETLPAADRIELLESDTEVISSPLAQQMRRQSFIRRYLSFESMVRVAEKAEEIFRSKRRSMCRELKTELSAHEDHRSGRVPISRLNDAPVKSQFGRAQSFVKNEDELRRIGALDESLPSSEPRVIISNYLRSSANCVSPSGFYALCCPDECDGLMRELERLIAAPQAAPEVILKLVAGLSSPTVSAPRNLSAPLLSRLKEVAKVHGGTVPLHGRLFAQWMHHAFPRECTYPQKIATQNTWVAKPTGELPSGHQSEYSEPLVPAAGAFRENDGRESDGAPDDTDPTLPWDPEEQLLIIRPQPAVNTGRSLFWTRCQLYAFYVAVASAAISLGQVVKSALFCADDLMLMEQRERAV
jgi:hypothetical protein